MFASMAGFRSAPPRRIEALAYIMERIQRSGTCPSYGEIGRALVPPVDRSRAGQLVDQLVERGFIERPPASRRGIQICDAALCRRAIEEALGQQGWQQPSTFGELPLIPPFEHIPDVD